MADASLMRASEDPRITAQRGVVVLPREGSADEVVVTEHLDVESLPRRVVHVVHALMTRPQVERDYGPYSASEIMLYDEQALDVRQTSRALQRAKKLGLVACYGRYWTPTFISLAHRSDFETRYLRDTEREAEGTDG